MTPAAIVLGPDYELISALGSRGIPVVVATDEALGALAHSRFVAGVERAPGRWSGEYTAWLDALLARHDGAVVFAWADVTAWLLARRRDRAGTVGAALTGPSMDAFARVVPKFRLYELCVAAGIGAPRTWLATDVQAALAGAAGARYPLMVKPQSRVGNLHWGQGQLVRSDASLREAARWAIEAFRFRDEVTASMPGIDTPMVQEVVGGRDRPVYHLCGYLSHAGDSAVLAHRKLLQAPRRFGNGLCFETAPVDRELAERLVAMLRSVGYSGIFEGEFLERDGGKLLIDLNTRAYNGMRLETERALNLPWFAYLEATHEGDRLREELRRAADLPQQEGMVWCRKLEFAAMIGGQFVSGGLGGANARRWIGWYREHRRQMVDPWEGTDDTAIGRRRLLTQIRWWAANPRMFLGVYARRESGR